MSQKEIFMLATQFRTALEKFGAEPESFWKTITNRFPHGCCDDASMLLATYLADNGFPGSIRVHGEHGGRTGELNSHVWLELNGLDIDITADQFEAYDLPTVVVEASTSPFHQGFKVEEKLEPADFRIKFANDEKWLSFFKVMYHKTKLHIPS